MLTLAKRLDLGLGAFRNGGVAPPDPNVLAGLSWIAGPETTLSQSVDKARATGTNFAVANPRIYLGPFNLTGVSYRLTGEVFLGTAAPIYVRVDSSATLSAGGPFNTPYGDDTPLNEVFTPGAGAYYFGIVPVIDENGKFGEISLNVSIAPA